MDFDDRSMIILSSLDKKELLVPIIFSTRNDLLQSLERQPEHETTKEFR